MPVPTFDLPIDKTGCVDRCLYGQSKKCTVTKNPNERYPSRKALVLRNWELINSKKFESEITAQIRKKRINDFRWFSSGDFFSLESIDKVIKVCKNLSRIRHWIATSRDDLLKEWLKDNSIPENVNIRLSAPVPNMEIPQFMIDEFSPFGVTFSETTTDPHKANCHASISTEKGINCGDCDLCWKKDHKITKYYLKGVKNEIS